MKRPLFQPPKPESGKTDAPKPDPIAQKALSDIADLNLLKLLQSLKLTVRNIDKLLVPMREASVAAVKLDKEDSDALKKLAPTITTAREAMLSGKGIGRENQEKIDEIFDESTVRRAKARTAAEDSVVAVFKNELSKEQLEEIDKMGEKLLGFKPVPKQYAGNPNKVPKEVISDILQRVYIRQVFLLDKTIVLLESMKKAVPPKDKEAGDK
jgi:hypothetical protein